jgi:hypothetical protein
MLPNNSPGKENKIRTQARIFIAKKECRAMEIALDIAGINIDPAQIPTLLAIQRLREIKGTRMSIDDVINISTFNKETFESLKDSNNSFITFLYVHHSLDNI